MITCSAIPNMWSLAWRKCNIKNRFFTTHVTSEYKGDAVYFALSPSHSSLSLYSAHTAVCLGCFLFLFFLLLLNPPPTPLYNICWPILEKHWRKENKVQLLLQEMICRVLIMHTSQAVQIYMSPTTKLSDLELIQLSQLKCGSLWPSSLVTQELSL